MLAMRSGSVRMIALIVVVLAVPLQAAAPASPQASPQAGPTSAPASDGRLEIRLELANGIEMDRVPMRTAKLHFRNVSREPLRLYLPQAESFRAMISDVTLKPAHGTAFWVPDPHPHGYVITEIDFPLLAPGESRTFTQKFTLDPMVPGPGDATRRRPGFEAGQQVSVTWTYENKVTRWQGGAQTLDGPMRTLFEGKPIPHIWTGEVSTRLAWTVPKE